MSAAPTLKKELATQENGRAWWDDPRHRREAFRSLHRWFRYGLTFNAPYVLPFQRRERLEIGDLARVQRLTSTTIFNGLLVVQGDTILFEKTAHDFSPQQPHPCMSMTKMMTNLMVGKLVDEGAIDLTMPVSHYLPNLGSGYAPATIQQVLDMNVVNDFSEDYFDDKATIFRYFDAYGWKLRDGRSEPLVRDALRGISGTGSPTPDGKWNYKTANTDLLGWIAESVSGVPLRQLVMEIVEAAGCENAAFMGCDRSGVPIVGGALNLCLRDLARYGLLLARGGVGVSGQKVGSKTFISRSMAERTQGAHKVDDVYYRNQVQTNGTWFGHGGWGGQWLAVEPRSHTVVAFYSVLQEESGLDYTYINEVMRMAGDIIAELAPVSS